MFHSSLKPPRVDNVSFFFSFWMFEFHCVQSLTLDGFFHTQGVHFRLVFGGEPTS